jgi:hypothetical protein
MPTLFTLLLRSIDTDNLYAATRTLEFKAIDARFQFGKWRCQCVVWRVALVVVDGPT